MVTNYTGETKDTGSKVAPPKEIKRMMGVTKKPNGGYHVSINASSLDLIQTCLKKAQFQLRDGLVSKDPMLAPTFGTGIHKALEIFYAAPREARSLPPGYKNKIAMICQGTPVEGDELVLQAARGFYNEVGEELKGLPDEDKRSLANGAWLLGEYFEARIHDPYEVFFYNDKPCVETLYEANLIDTPELTIDVFGTVDAIMQNKANGSLVICDHKTSSATFMGDFFNRTKPNHQYTCYVWLIEQCLGLGIENFMINIFQVKPRPKTSRGKGPDFMHIITKRSAEDIESFKQSVIFYVLQYITCLEADYFPIGTVNACAMYGRCSFLQVCESPASIQQNILNANFKKRGAE
jgi:hypothetical protein